MEPSPLTGNEHLSMMTTQLGKVVGQKEETPHQNWIQRMTNLGSNAGSSQRTCPGITREESLQFQKTQVVLNQPALFKNSAETSSQPNCTSDLLQEHREESQCWNGNISSRERPLTSTRSSLPSIAYQFIQRERLLLVMLKSVSEELR